MACSSCGTGGGCSTSANSGGCGKSGGCSSGGCNKLNSYDWLGNMEMDSSNQFDLVEVKFKGGRKEYFRNSNKLELYTGDAVITDVPNGHHLGHVSLQGELVRLQMKKKEIVQDENLRTIYRKATQKDLEKYEQARAREESTLYRTRQLARDLKLEMKLSDVEFQADNIKATFYYSADERVDFRELIKMLAAEFKIRIEMKQISLRQEASRLGGIGSCGRELCCSTWLTDFKNVNTSAARYQNLALNPTKLSGQCGRLKCCLNYELDTYMDALKGIPEIQQPISTLHGDAVLQKTDIFKKIMWFAYKDDITTWQPISVERVNHILEQNKKGRKPATLDSDEEVEKGISHEEKKEKEELSRFDDKFGKKKKRKKKKNKSGGQGNNENRNPQNEENRNKPQQENRNQQGGGQNKNKPQHNNNKSQQGGEQKHNKPQHQHRNQQGGENKNKPQNQNRNPQGPTNKDNVE
ncbi:MAG TPA: regulatory iron-sulfur-containing complex subunit RicT [Cytophagaceae bacterium]|nr:regulatory iron-sulfur-containing complex subunit RicT [Cytophagaceae bacterium]